MGTGTQDTGIEKFSFIGGSGSGTIVGKRSNVSRVKSCAFIALMKFATESSNCFRLASSALCSLSAIRDDRRLAGTILQSPMREKAQGSAF